MKVLEKRAWLVYDCKLCNSKLEAEVGDVRSYVDCDGDMTAWLECLVCGDKKYLKRNEVPPKALHSR